MTKTAQNWLDTTYGNKNSVVKVELHSWNPWIDSEELTGDLLIDDYINVEEILVERWERGGDGKSRGKITKVTISNCPKLKKLCLESNEIKEIVFKDKLPNLTELRLGDNQLTKVDISNLPALSFLNLTYNSITDIKGIEYLTNLHMISLFENPGFNGRQYREWGDAIKDLLGIPLTNPLPDTWKNDLKVKLDGLKNQPGQKELENKIKSLLGIGVNDLLPSDWEKQLVKKTDLDNANNKIRGYEDGLKADLGLNDSTLPNWRNEIAKLKNRPASNPVFPITKEQWDNDYSQRPTKQEFEKIQKLHNAIESGAKKKFGSDWKKELEIEKYYNSIEQSNK